MLDDLVFGWRTAILAVAIVQLLLIAAALPRTLANRAANRTLAVLLVILAGIETPWAIGFAGFYDRWRWLTFSPFAITLAVAPLFWIYVQALVTGERRRRDWPHLVPAIAQFAFLSASFALPTDAKNRWYAIASAPYDLITGLLVIIGLLLYGHASLVLLRRYRTALAACRSDDHRFAARWASRAIGAAFALTAIWAAFIVADWLHPLGYTGLMGLYVAIAAFALYLAIEGWRHAALPFPSLKSLVPVPMASAPPRDWRTQGELWAEKVRTENWQGYPDLSIATLARRLGTNTNHLSRALNEGLGLSFSSFVNGLRCESLAARLRSGDPRDLLDLALEAGFSSKASFNRAFQARFGVSPSAFRRAHASHHE